MKNELKMRNTTALLTGFNASNKLPEVICWELFAKKTNAETGLGRNNPVF